MNANFPWQRACHRILPTVVTIVNTTIRKLTEAEEVVKDADEEMPTDWYSRFFLFEPADGIRTVCGSIIRRLLISMVVILCVCISFSYIDIFYIVVIVVES